MSVEYYPNEYPTKEYHLKEYNTKKAQGIWCSETSFDFFPASWDCCCQHQSGSYSVRRSRWIINQIWLPLGWVGQRQLILYTHTPITRPSQDEKHRIVWSYHFPIIVFLSIYRLKKEGTILFSAIMFYYWNEIVPSTLQFVTIYNP